MPFSKVARSFNVNDGLHIATLTCFSLERLLYEQNNFPKTFVNRLDEYDIIESNTTNRINTGNLFGAVGEDL